MDGMLLPIVSALAVMLLVFSAAQIVATLTNAERRKLKQRLSSEGGTAGQGGGAAGAVLVLQQESATGLTGLLLHFSLFAGINRKLMRAWPEASLGWFLGIAAGAGAALFLLACLLTQSVLLGVVAGVVGLYIPLAILSQRGAKRQRQMCDQLPEALDFLSRVLRAGHSLSTGLQMMAEELPRPLAGEFRRAYDQHSLGTSLEEALKSMAVRIESTDFAFFVTAVLIQRQTGGDLSEVLGNISGMIRQRIRLQQHVKAKTAEGRFTGFILAAFPAVMFVIAYVLNPAYAGVLVRTGTGLMLLGTAVGLQLIGLYFIKRITTVTV